LTLEGDELLAIGRIAKPFGVHGEVVVRVLADDPARFRSVHRVHLGISGKDARPVEVRVVNIQPRGVRVRILGVTTRGDAERLVGQVLFVDRRGRRRLPPGTFFVHSIIGMKVRDEEGVERGRVKRVLKLPAQDVYVIEYEGREFLLPAVREFVRSVDTKQKILTVRLIEGILE